MRFEKHRDTLTVHLEGELDHCCAQSIRREMDRLLEEPQIRRLVIDMGDMSFMDSSGIGVILGRYRLLASRGGSVAVRNMNRQVARIFQLSGMGQIIEVMQG
ncbi:MAG: anti-sigma factor antagonist [Clostridia bacterium]|nr:anti-sigma factor antagonist [Clostridia bacterium]